MRTGAPENRRPKGSWSGPAVPRSPFGFGTILIELMAVLILFGVFTVVAGNVFYSTMRVTMDSHDVPRIDLAQRAMARQLRDDVWGATEMAAADRKLTLRYAADRSVAWTITGAEDRPSIKRTAYFGEKAEDERSWDVPGLPERFEPFGPGVRVHLSPVKHHRLPPLDLYSELVQLAGGGR